jgi:hypothetical protein
MNGKRFCVVLLVFAALFSGCDAIKGLLGEDVGPESGGGGTGSVSAVFEGVLDDGEGTTTLVTLEFDRDIAGLSENDVWILDPDETGAVKGALVKSGTGTGIYSLSVSGVKAAGTVTVTVGKTGYAFTPASRTIDVSFDDGAQKVTFVNIMPNGVPGLVTTTALTLTFTSNETVPVFEPGDITLWPGSTGAAMGALINTGAGTYTLEVSGVTAAEEIGVTVVKSGYTVSPATISSVLVNCYQIPRPVPGGAVTYFAVEDNPAMEWEIHTFTANGTLDFGGVPPSLTAQVLVVAGGGGGGLSQDSLHPAGGGGAGGYIYVPSFPIQTGLFTVKVGAGGAKPTSYGSPNGPPNATKGATGGDSEFGGIIARGGGGGASHAGASGPGASGGSGGGSSYKGSDIAANPGTVPAGIQNAEILGNRGGNITGEQGSTGTGGGGAGGTGGDTATIYQATPGGAGATSGISGEEREYARGGNAGGDAGADGAANTGNGGKGGTGTDGKGGSGIVIVRFQRPVGAP